MSKKIRFIDSKYNDLFQVEDNQAVTITMKDGYEITKKCKFIDEYHFYFGSTCYHICEFAERMEANENIYKPSI